MRASIKPQCWLPHLLLAKLASHSTTRKKPDWSDVKQPQGCMPLPLSWHISGQGTTGHCCMATPMPSGIESCWDNSYLLHVSFPSVQNNNLSVTTVKSSPLGKRLNCLSVLQSSSKRNKTHCAKTPDQH